MSASHPVLFSAPMVRAILAGRKTQTRRVVWVGDAETRMAYYRADGVNALAPCDWAAGGYPDHCRFHPGCEGCEPQVVRWKSPRCMPRWASRLTLEVTAVRVERVQEITCEGITAEGVPGYDGHVMTNAERRRAFAGPWDAINAKRGAGWDANPWVWVIEFRRVEG